jgi:dihydroxy-acid dehydratase
MTKGEWLYQLRLTVSDALASSLRGDDAAKAHPALHDALRRHGATVVCQFDAFAGYVREAEQNGPDGYPLYQWTRATIEDPGKQAKYLRSFTVYVGGEQVYPRDVADALEAELRSLAEPEGIAAVSKFDTNPANNPQPPR